MLASLGSSSMSLLAALMGLIGLNVGMMSDDLT
jgi:hypothetical protein